jgi:hypothetical protein
MLLSEDKYKLCIDNSNEKINVINNKNIELQK